MKFSGKFLLKNTSAKLLLGEVSLKLNHIRQKIEYICHKFFNPYSDFLYIPRRLAAILFSIYAKLPIIGMNYSRRGQAEVLADSL